MGLFLKLIKKILRNFSQLEFIGAQTMTQVFEQHFVDPTTNEIFIKSLSPETQPIPLQLFLQLHNKLVQQYNQLYHQYTVLRTKEPETKPLSLDSIKCPISDKVMTNPVIDTITGVTFDWNSFIDDEGQLKRMFPTIPHRVILEEELIPNHTLRKVISENYNLKLDDPPPKKHHQKLHPPLKPTSIPTIDYSKARRDYEEKFVSSKIILTLCSKKGSVKEHIYQKNPYVFFDNQGSVDYQRYEKVNFRSTDTALTPKDCKIIDICKKGMLHGLISNNNPLFYNQRTDLDDAIQTLQGLVPRMFETLLDAATTCEKMYESKLAKTFVTFVNLHEDKSKLKENKIIILNAARALLDHVWDSLPNDLRTNKNYRELISQFQYRVFDDNAKPENAELIIFPKSETSNMVRLIILCNGAKVDMTPCKNNK